MPIFKRYVTPSKLATKMMVIKAGLSLTGATKYVSTTKPGCLPNSEIEDSNNPHIAEEKEEIKKHLVELYWITYAFQNNLPLMNYINKSKSVDWPNGRLCIIFTKIERFFKMTLCDIDPYKKKK